MREKEGGRGRPIEKDKQRGRREEGKEEEKEEEGREGGRDEPDKNQVRPLLPTTVEKLKNDPLAKRLFDASFQVHFKGQ